MTAYVLIIAIVSATGVGYVHHVPMPGLPQCMEAAAQWHRERRSMMDGNHQIIARCHATGAYGSRNP